ncbi:MAG TPA: ACT domain-containing protein [bacterium]|nr:ACT domain-containing protein [bacterium]
MKVKQLSVFVENQPGRLASVAKSLGGAGINIMAMTIAETREFGVVRMIVADWERGIKFLKESGFTVTTTDVLAIEVKDNPGALAKVLEVFVSRGLNVEYMYAFVAKREGTAILVFRFDDPDQAIQALAGTGVKVLTNEEVLTLEK